MEYENVLEFYLHCAAVGPNMDPCKLLNREDTHPRSSGVRIHDQQWNMEWRRRLEQALT